MEARKLVDFPGGLELHIGVRISWLTFPQLLEHVSALTNLLLKKENSSCCHRQIYITLIKKEKSSCCHRQIYITLIRCMTCADVHSDAAVTSQPRPAGRVAPEGAWPEADRDLRADRAGAWHLCARFADNCNL
jgi:hypothetical protein